MGYIGTKPADAALTSSDLEDGIVTAAKLATDSVETAKVKDVNVTAGKLAATQDLSTKTITLPATVAGLGTGITNAQLAGSIDVTSKITGVVPAANLGSGTASASTYLAGNQTYQTIAEYDDNVIQSNIAMLGFYVAVNGSLVRYNLVDQSIDEYYDTSGVDSGASSNDRRVASGSNFYYEGTGSSTPTRTEDADDTGVDGDYTWFKWTDTGATGSYSADAAETAEFLVVAGGASGGEQFGGGGAGGLRTSYGSTSGGGAAAQSDLSLGSGITYTMTIGTGGAGSTSGGKGDPGVASSLTGSDITDVVTVGGGYGACCGGYPAGGVGGSGGGGGDPDAGTNTGGAGTSGEGYAGGDGCASGGSDSVQSGGGGGGASAVGVVGVNSTSAGNGGAGLAVSITGSSVTYAGGGGGGAGGSISGSAGTGGAGGGGNGSKGASSATSGTANTGGGGGGGFNSLSGAGGTGIVIIRVLTDAVTSGGNMTLQSTDVTAESEPDYAELVILMENAYGTATLNTDIKGFVSEDSGVTFTEGTLVDEGSWGTNKKILAFHDLDISAQSGTSMCYKITTHNQVASSKETRVYATSIGWR